MVEAVSKAFFQKNQNIIWLLVRYMKNKGLTWVNIF